ncbi:LegC family aminotransferase [Brevibacillus parabrevis]|uniref:LegC family aminotransferase n=1 Tax=Brevibacillus parabrevis TaxID=54914 RepID=UPI002380ABDA|nr:LegC family aminotransferase [Brevibacillus parabrevis]MED2256169.1 LegC family aminotransferase [Brevibacillus parabrevis]WDV94960.1 LegC family aminotransferase [Brevibacillus parabrevis]
MKNYVDIQTLIKKLKSVVNADNEFIALHEPSFQGNEWAYVKECLDTGWVSSVGKYVDQFEGMLRDYTGVKHAVAVVNGTAALHISLILAGVKQGDEVLVPTLTFIATANAVSYCGATPHFVDSSEQTLGMDPIKLQQYLHEIAVVRDGYCYNKFSGRRIKAAIPMHTFGHPVDLDPLYEVCERYHIDLIEDAAESLGSYYKGKHTGNWGKLSTLSFNGNKIVTTGGGGAILTNDDELARLAKHITTTAKVKHAWAFLHDQVGYNYRLPNINAALGCAQLEKLPEFLRSKRSLTAKYQTALSTTEGVQLFLEPSFADSNYWLQTLVLEGEYMDARDDILNLTNEQGFMTRPAWTLMHKLAMYENCPQMDLSVAEGLERKIINIPSSPFLGGNHE